MFIKGIGIHLLVFHSPCHKGFSLGKAVCLVLRLRLFAAEHSDNQVSGRSFSDVGMTMTCLLQEDGRSNRSMFSFYIFRLYCHWIDITWRLKSTLFGFLTWLQYKENTHGSTSNHDWYHLGDVVKICGEKIGCPKDRMGSKMVFILAQHENPMGKKSQLYQL